MTALHGVCYSLVPVCINYKTKEPKSQKKISKIFELDLPAIMLKFNKIRVDSQSDRRYKRFVSTLAIILFDEVNAL